ncbi:MAG: ATP-binding protein [Anaerolineae bacterium]|jgi:signal transduction histidine kinase|nr:ATP-binding protein [Anaerolineae bacterium]
MSIRFRLTLLYSSILTLTLFVFGILLYSTQAQGTLSSLKRDLVQSSERIAANSFPNPGVRPPVMDAEGPVPPKTFDEFSSEPVFKDLREREIVRILDAEGNLLVSPFGRSEDGLPLDETGLAALQNNQDWWTNTVVEDEHLLIYNRPITDRYGSVELILQVARRLTERDRSLRTLAVTLLSAGGVTVLIAFAVGWWLSGMSLRPIDRITQTAKAIGDERDFTRRVDYEGPPDEIGRLASTFNQMLGRLQQAYDRVEHSLTKQRDFVADVSHELRTPLTTLRGNLGLLRREPPLSAEEESDIVSDMVEESDRLIRLVNDLLLLARAEAGRSFFKQAIQILPVIEETVRQVQLLDPQREIHLEIPGNLQIWGDRDAFKQVTLILLDNAVKHSDGTIEIRAQGHHGKVLIEIQDHGDGIDPEILPYVFDRFYRGEEEAQLRGFGLGLPIAKALVEELEGSISIESENGKGSTVTLAFQMSTMAQDIL